MVEHLLLVLRVLEGEPGLLLRQLVLRLEGGSDVLLLLHRMCHGTGSIDCRRVGGSERHGAE